MLTARVDADLSNPNCHRPAVKSVIAAQIALDNAQKTGRTTMRHYSRDIDPALVNVRIRCLRSISMCPAHDLLLEGIDLMLKKRGRPSIAALTKKE